MGDATKYYPGKLLLFGEYTVLHGGQALAIPFNKYSGHWRFLVKTEQCKYPLKPFFKYLQANSFLQSKIDLDAFANEIDNGIIFDSTIPIGYGAGSSGSLCAAIWDRYGCKISNIAQLRTIFIRMESFFHGKSSGIDPLVSYLNRPILQSGEGLSILEPITLPKEIQVYDSGISRSTAPLVEWYQDELAKNPNFKHQVIDLLLPQNEKAIKAVIEGDGLALKKAFIEISRWQREYFEPLILNSVMSDWEKAREKRAFFKICGAGAGGFYLVYDEKED